MEESQMMAATLMMAEVAPDSDNATVSHDNCSPDVDVLYEQHTPEDPKAQLRKALDLLSDNVAVLDIHGNIVMTNAAWQQFALAHSLRPGQTKLHAGVGNNYFDVASRCANLDDKSSQGLQGIRDVLSGRVEAFNVSYPCHTPHEQHWFTMTVTPLQWEGKRGALVKHTETTPRHRLHQR
jgi:hypothetical protein